MKEGGQLIQECIAIMYSDSDRDRQSDVRAFSDVVDATVST